MPRKGEFVKFKNNEKKIIRSTFIIYADFKRILEALKNILKAFSARK